MRHSVFVSFSKNRQKLHWSSTSQNLLQISAVEMGSDSIILSGLIMKSCNMYIYVISLYINYYIYDYIVWPDHAVILGHFLARPLSHCLEGKNQWQLTFGHFIWLSPQKYKQCWLRCSSWSIWALFNLETFLGEMTTTWYFSYKKAEKIDNAN